MNSAPDLATAIALRLLGRLESYEDRIMALAEAWDDDLYAEVAASMDVMQVEATSISIGSAWAEFNISHVELIRHLLKRPAVGERLDRLEAHIGRMLDLQGKCLSLGTVKPRLK